MAKGLAGSKVECPRCKNTVKIPSGGVCKHRGFDFFK
jgi:ribosomal protein S27E